MKICAITVGNMPDSAELKGELHRVMKKGKRNDDFPQKETTPGIVTCQKLREGYPQILQQDAAAESDRSGKGNGCALMESTCAWWRAHFTENFCSLAGGGGGGASVFWCLLAPQCLALRSRDGHLNDIWSGQNARGSLAARNSPSNKLRSIFLGKHRKLTNQQNP